MSSTVKVIVPTQARRGGFRRHNTADPDNLVGHGLLPAGEYEAHIQCVGQEIRQPGRGSSSWWVCVTTPWGLGWVTALHVDGGDSGDPVHGVSTRGTEFEAPQIANGPLVTVIREADMYTGGAISDDPNNHVGQELLPAGAYRAMAQCVGQAVDNGENRNYWWVFLHTTWPSGTTVNGWVNAVDIATGDDDGPIPAHGLPKLPTVFSTHPTPG